MNKYLFILGIVLFILYIWAFFIEPNLLIVKRYKAKNLLGKKIVFVSDFHIGKRDGHRLQRIVNKINELNPDIVLSCGDFIKGYSEKDTMPIEKQVMQLAGIKSPVVTVLGNHDGFYDKYRIKTELENIGVIVLHNTNIQYDGIYIAGVEDLKTGFTNVETALENTEAPRILLTHSPDIYYDIKEDIDLILAGHVHGGQVRIPFLGALICPSKFGTKFSSGDFKETQNRMIVTSGLGSSILTVRFCDIPEIVLLEEG